MENKRITDDELNNMKHIHSQALQMKTEMETAQLRFEVLKANYENAALRLHIKYGLDIEKDTIDMATGEITRKETAVAVEPVQETILDAKPTATKKTKKVSK